LRYFAAYQPLTADLGQRIKAEILYLKKLTWGKTPKYCTLTGCGKTPCKIRKRIDFL
jgi:hypothetical protein